MASAVELQPPLLIVDETHHGAWVAIAAAYGLTLTLVCLLIRLYVRTVVSPPFGIDDIVLLCATVSERLFVSGLEIRIDSPGLPNLCLS